MLGEKLAADADAQTILVMAALEFDAAILRRRIRDWGNNQTVQNRMKDDMDDRLYQLEQNFGVRLPITLRDALFEKILSVARHRDHA